MIEALKEAGGDVQDSTIGIGPVHATMVHSILRYAMKPEKVAAAPDETVILGHLRSLLDQFVGFVGTQP